jgi:hypothetical protein
MSTLAIRNSHERDSSISFEESCHVYTIKGSSANVISVTKFLHYFFPEFNAKEVIQKMRKGKNWSTSEYNGMTDYQIMTKWKENGQVSSAAGTRLHLAIEQWLDGQADRIDKEVLAMREWAHFQAFWAKEGSEIEPYRLEWPVWVEELKLAGSIDGVFRRRSDGAFLIYDWKRSKDIKIENRYETGLGPIQHLPNTNYWQYTLQLNIYRWILETHYGLTIADMYLVILHPDNASYVRMKLNRMDEEVEDMIAARRDGLVNHQVIVVEPRGEGCAVRL